MIRKESLQIRWMKYFSQMVIIDHGVVYFTYRGLTYHLGTYFDKLYVNDKTDDSCLYCKADISLDDLESKYFLDILIPTDNELVLFELEYGFEWPFQEKNKTANQRSN